MQIIKVKDFPNDGYCVVWYEDGSRRTFASWMAPDAVEKFKDYCSEKGIASLTGQAVEYRRDSKFRTL